MIEASRLEFQRRKTSSVGPSLQTLNEQLDIATGHPAFLEEAQRYYYEEPVVLEAWRFEFKRPRTSSVAPSLKPSTNQLDIPQGHPCAFTKPHHANYQHDAVDEHRRLI